MPPVKSSGGQGSLPARGNAAGPRGGRDGPPFSSSSGNGAVGLPSEASLESSDVIRQLLTIAQGDVSAAAALSAIESSSTASGVTEGSGGHGAAATRVAKNSLTDTAVHGGHGLPRDNSAVARDEVQRALPNTPQPVLELRPLLPVPLNTDCLEAPTGKAQEAAEEGSSASTVSADGEACVFYLTAFVAHALGMDDYWVDLRHQIEVDQHVEFLRYCAARDYGASKTLHLLQWWRQYRQLVSDDGATHLLQLLDGNPLCPPPPPPPSALLSPVLPSSSSVGGTEDAAAAAAAGDGHSSAAKESGGKGAAKKGGGGHRVSAAGAAAEAESRGDSASAAAAAAAAAPPFPVSAPEVSYATHKEAVEGELQRFVQWELEHEHAWRQVPREPLFSPSSGLLSPTANNSGGGRGGSSAGGGGAAAASAAAASAAPGGKSSKADKAKMQQQQLQETGLEEQRLARIAALPPDNIFLTKPEAADFVRRVVAEDLIRHAALYAYVAAHEEPPSCHLLHAAVAPVVFSVQVEVPMPVPQLREAVRVCTATTAAAGGGGSPLVSPPVLTDAPEAHGTAQRPQPVTAPSRPASSAAAASKPLARGDSKNANAHGAMGDGGEDRAATAATPPLLSAKEQLRAEQAKEAAAYRAAYAEESALAAARAQAAQHADDVRLFFDNSSTETAVQAVYASMEDGVAARQHGILQRIAVLEAALGLTEVPAAGEPGAA